MRGGENNSNNKNGTRRTHRGWCVSNGSQTLQRGQLGRLCLPDVVLLRHWGVRCVSFATTGRVEREGKRKEKTTKRGKKKFDEIIKR